MLKTQKKERKKYITILHVFCAFAVIILHANNSFWQFENSSDWIIANAIESIFYFAVPVFMMVSSATLLDYRDRYDTNEFIKKRVKKTLIPYIFWTSVALLVFGLLHKIDFKPNPFERIVRAFFHADVYEMNIYNFFLELFVCYMCVPLISLIPKDKRQKPFLFIILYGIIVHSILPLVFNVYHIGISIPNLPILGSYMLFMFIGYYIDNYEIKLPIRIFIYALGLISLFIHLYLTQKLSLENNYIVCTYKGYLNAPSVLYATAIFTLFKYLDKTKFFDILYKGCKIFAPTTLGIYLIHRYFILFAWDYMNIAKTSLIFKTLGSVIIFFLSFAITKILQKIPVIKNIVP